MESKLLGKYKNGNVLTKIYNDGTKVRFTEDDEFNPEYAENMDIKICNRCDMGCAYCHEGSTPDGEIGDIMNEKFVETLHPYQEVALGGGNVLEHPDLIPFLEKLKEHQVIANITLNQYHFEKNLDTVRYLVDNKLIWGLGVSLMSPDENFVKTIKEFPNAVIHVINGIILKDDLELLENKGLKILFLGYKKLRRGNDCYNNNEHSILKNISWLETAILSYVTKFDVVSFDNLAIEQLHIKDKLPEDVWNAFYAGDDGTNTFYIDMVERKFAKSSTASFDKRYDLLDDVEDMFNFIREHD